MIKPLSNLKIKNYRFIVSKTISDRLGKSKKHKIALIALIVLAILAPAVYFTLLHPRATTAAWFNDNWLYRKAVNITNGSGSTLTDFQVSISIGTSAPIAAGKMKSDCSDIRVTDTNGKLLPHLIDTGPSGCNTDTTNVWTKVPSIPTSGGTVYVYYGNPSAINTQNGKNVFAEYDLTTFTKVDPNTRFTISSAQQVTTTNMSSNEDAYVYKQIPSQSTGTIDVDINRTSGGTKITCVGVSSELNDCLGVTDGAYIMWSWGGYFQGLRGDNAHSSNISAISAGTNYYLTIKYDGTNASFYVYSNPQRTTLLGSQSFTFSSSWSYLYAVSSYNDNSAATINDTLRNFHIRKYASTDPSSSLSSTEEQSPGPVAYWKFDEGYGSTASDSTQNANNGTLGTGNSAPTWQPEDMCVSGKCLKFDGSNDIIDFGTNNSLKTTDALTISLWVKRPDKTTFERFLSHSTDANNYAYELGVDFTDKDNWRFRLNNDAVTLKVPMKGSANEWIQLAVTYDKNAGGTTEMKMYENGVLIGTQDYSTALSNHSSLKTNRQDKTDGFLKSFIDEVKIYPYARTAAQIKSDYASQGAIKGVSAQMGDEPSWLSEGLVGYWKMDETVSPSLDSSGVGNTGAWTGTATAASGKFGNAISLDGDSDYVTCGTTGIPTTTPITLSTWAYFNVDQPASNYDYVVQASDYVTNGDIFNISREQTTNNFYYVEDGNVKTGPALPTTQWTHIVVVFNSSMPYVQLYINGQPQAVQQPSSALAPGGGAKCVIGRLSGTGYTGHYLNGKADDVRIYNRALSPAEVRDLYNWAPGPVGYWDFNIGTGGTAPDISGNGNNGNWSGTGTHWATGKYGQAGQFNGSDDYVDAGGNSSLNITGTTITYETWIKVNETLSSSQYRSILIKATGAGSWNGLWYVNGTSGITCTNKFLFGLNGTWLTCSTTTPEIGKWYHIAARYDGSTAKIYINGIEESSVNYSTPIASTSTNQYIGKRSDGYFFNGFLDEVKIYNYARSPAQIKADMLGRTSQGGSALGVLMAGPRDEYTPVAHWRFDEGYGSTAYDQTGTNNGTLGTGNSAPSWSNDGKFGKALNFDGNDYINTGNNSVFDFERTDTFSLTAWVKSSTTGKSIVSKMGGSADNSYRGWDLWEGRGSGSNKLTFFLINTYSSNAIEVYGSTNILDNSWHHVTATYNGNSSASGVKLYVDGKPEILTIAYDNLNATTKNSRSVFIGARDRSTGPEYQFNGLIDEVKVYNFALTEDQVRQEYNQASGLVMGTLSSGTGNTAPSTAASQEYCVPGDTASCAGPVARWDFNEGVGGTANDSSGNGNTGTLGTGNSAPTWTTGKIGKGLSFDGSNDYVNANDSNSLNITGNITLEAWVKLNGTPVNYSTVVSKEGPNAGYAIMVHSDRKVQAWIGDGDWQGVQDTSTALQNGIWYHIASIYNGTSIKVYVNGKKEGSDVTQGNPSSTSGRSLYIGSSVNNPTTRLFNGFIDHVRIYNYARTPAQIAWDYNRGGPVGHWKFDECQGITVYDASGNSNNGSINIGATAPQTSAGTCTDGLSTSAWYNGATGKYNSSLNFDGVDDYVNCGDVDEIDGVSRMSMSAWMKRDSSADKVIIAKQTDTNHRLAIELWDNGNAYVLMANGSNGYGYVANTGTDWQHLVMVFNGDGAADADKLKLFINGVNQTLTYGNTIPSTTADQSSNLEIGRRVDGQYTDGQIDDVRIYNYALTAEQVKLLYNAGSAVYFGP